MKKLILLTALLIALLFVRANDTLTRAQVYNFDVGDTFDYKIETYSTLPFNKADHYVFVRHVIEGKTISANADSIYYQVRKETVWQSSFETWLVTNLDSSPIYFDTLQCPGGQTSLLIQGNSAYNGRVTNKYRYITVGCGLDTTFGAGIGVIHASDGYGDGTGAYYNVTTTLIYYSKGTEKYGSPYYNFTGEELLSYTPIPEECAEWISEIYKLYPYPSPTAVNLLHVSERIRTGNKVQVSGHWGIELIYTGYEYMNSDNHIDSLIGYFRNDTAYKKVYFRPANGTPVWYTIYNFNVTNGYPEGAYHINLSRVALNQDTVTKWDYSEGAYLEGIGGLYGFIKVKSVGDIAPGGVTYQKYGTLKCFSVCGQVIYPSDTASCPLVNSIASNFQDISLSLTPNPASSYLTISISEEHIGSTLTLTDLTGRVVLQSEIYNPKSEINIASLPGGIYLATLTTPSGQRAMRKVVKE
jgi:hypothetical protein